MRQVAQQAKHPGQFFSSAAIALDSGFVTVSAFITTLRSTFAVRYGDTHVWLLLRLVSRSAKQDGFFVK
jgi:hypothetical protein